MCDMVGSVPQMSQMPEHSLKESQASAGAGNSLALQKNQCFKGEKLQDFSLPECLNETSAGLISTSNL